MVVVADTTAPTVTANVTGTFSEAMNQSTVGSSTLTATTPGATPLQAAVTYNSRDRVATLDPGADLKAGVTCTATIKGGSAGVKDAAGNALAADRTWTFTTAAPAGGGTSETLTLTATADSYVSNGTGLAGTNYGTSTMLGVDNSPMEVPYFKFDLSAYAGRTLESATLQLSLGIDSTSSDGLDLGSKEASGGTYAPKLVITLTK